MIGAKLFPLLIYVWSWIWLKDRFAVATAAGISSVEDFIVLNSACYYGDEDDESGYVDDNLRLRDLVAASDVIIKTFAGDGNYLRPVLAASGEGGATHGNDDGADEMVENLRHGAGNRNRNANTTGTSNVQDKEEHGNEENRAATSISGEDFILRLEPSVVYKGNEIYKKLKLINWQHYVVIKSIASRQGEKGASSLHHPNEYTSSSSTPASSAARSGKYISSHSRAKCSRSNRRVITSSMNNSNINSGSRAEVHAAESRTLLNSSIKSTQDNKPSSKSKNNNSDQRQQQQRRQSQHHHPWNHQSNGNSAENNTPESDPLTVSSVFNEILPTELIIFGRLDDRGNLQVDLFSGLLYWDRDLESSIWREMGWSDWSEYTACSVSCGKGVQQRFRHCLRKPRPDAVRSRTMSSTPATPFRQEQQPYVNIEQQKRTRRKDGVMNNENVNPSSSFTTPSLKAATPARVGGRRVKAPESVPVEPTVAFTTEDDEDDVDDDEYVDNNEEETGPEPEPLTEDTDATEAPADPRTAIERHFNESTNANTSGERSIHSGSSSRLHPVFLPPVVDEYNGSTSAYSSSRDKKHLTTDSGGGCEGHNIEQRNCNMFDCTGSINLLTTSWSHQSNIGDVWANQLNYAINQFETNFTLMLGLRFKKQYHHRQGTVQLPSSSAPVAGRENHPTTNNIISLRSELANGDSTSSSLSINLVNDGHGGLKVIQEKFGLSEMLPVKHNLLDGKWHSLAMSGRNGGYIAVHVDCRWTNSFVLSMGAVELPQYPVIEAGRDIELGQLTLVPGDRVRDQCATDAIPITDTENRQVTNYFEGIN